jgi:hypothetical protein
MLIAVYRFSRTEWWKKPPTSSHDTGCNAPSKLVVFVKTQKLIEYSKIVGIYLEVIFTTPLSPPKRYYTQPKAPFTGRTVRSPAIAWPGGL